MSSTLIFTVQGTNRSIQVNSFALPDRIEERSRCQVVIDTDLSTTFSFGQRVTVTDSVLGELFSGIINTDGYERLHPNAILRHSIDCIDTTFDVDRLTSDEQYTNQYAGVIVADQHQKHLAAEGITAAYALRIDQSQADFAAGTLSNTTATSANDLELAQAGTQVNILQQTQADFAAGTGGFGLSATANGVTFTSTPAIKLMATESMAGLSNAYTYVKIWSGSYTIAATDILYYDIWLPDSCPKKMAGIDFVCSDGTTFRDSTSVNGTDLQSLGMHPSVDLSGVATNQWYSRRFFIDGAGAWVGKTIAYVSVAFEGEDQGDYTAYFRNIYIKNGATTKLTIFGSTATSIAITPQQMQNSGYSAMSCTFVTTYERHGAMLSPFFSVAGAGLAGNSSVSWDITYPNSADFTFTITASVDNFATFLPCIQGAAIPGLLPGMNLSGKNVIFVYVFDNVGNDPELTPVLSQVQASITSAYACTKSDSITTYNSQVLWNGGTLTNLTAPGGATLQINGICRNYDNADYSNQTLFGGGASPQGTQGINLKRFFITQSTGNFAISRLDWAGQWQNFIFECDLNVDSTTAKPSFVYRTTGWSNYDANYAYALELTTSSVTLQRGSNSSAASAGTRTQVATASLSLSSGGVHHLKAIINGSSHTFYLDDVLVLTTTDATYTASGYIGLRNSNATGSNYTVYFDNVGIVNYDAAHILSGTWVSPAIDIHSLGTISNSQVILQIDPANSATLSTYLVEISLNNGSTWSTCPNIQTTPLYYYAYQLPGLTPGTNVSSLTQIKLRITISLSTASAGATMPDVTAITLTILGAYSSSGTRSTAPIGNDTFVRANQSGWGTAFDGQAWAKTGIGTDAIASNEATITNTTGDVHEVLGSRTATDEEGTCRFSLSASTISGGMELRYVDANNFYRLSISTTTISIIKRSGGTSYTLATATIALSTSTFYRVRFRVTGSSLVSLFGRVWLDGTLEPTAWNVTTVD